jgi:hypothetical protein
MLHYPMGKPDTFSGPPDFKDTDHVSATTMSLRFAGKFRSILRMHLRSIQYIVTGCRGNRIWSHYYATG